MDDDPDLREVLALIVRRAFPGFQVMQASNGREALDSIRAHRPSVMTLDLRMPVMDGMEVLAELSRSDPTLPVLVLTAFGFNPALPELLQALSNIDFLVKPASVSSTVDTIKRVLSGRDGGAA